MSASALVAGWALVAASSSGRFVAIATSAFLALVIAAFIGLLAAIVAWSWDARGMSGKAESDVVITVARDAAWTPRLCENDRSAIR